MSLTSNLTQFSNFIARNIKPNVSRKLHGLLGLGIKAFCLQEYTSCNANARMSYAGSRASAEQAMFRLLHSSKLSDELWQATAHLVALSPNSLVNVDYSTFDPLAILGFAKQTKRGRAMPVLIETLVSSTGGRKTTNPKYQSHKDQYANWKLETGCDQYSFVMQGLASLTRLYGVKPRLVFDRGFMNSRILTYLETNDYTFYIRMRDDYVVTVNQPNYCYTCCASELTTGDYRVNWHGHQLRLAIGSKGRHQSAWRIVTNDDVSSLKQLLKIYYHRFEIEETFRDLKSLFRLKYNRIRTRLSLKVVLGFMSLTMVYALISHIPSNNSSNGLDSKLLGPTTRPSQILSLNSKPPPSNLHPCPKKQLSVIRAFQEGLKQELLAGWDEASS
jgi:hypothetical protein